MFVYMLSVPGHTYFMKKIYKRHSLLTPNPAELSLRITSHENKPFIVKQE